MFVSRVHSLLIHSAVLCATCSLVALVSDTIDDQIVLPCPSVVLVRAKYVFSSVSLDLPQCETVRGFSSDRCSIIYP